MQVGVEEVKKHPENVRDDKASGLDNMHLRVLREVAEQISVALVDIWNRSLESGQVLEDWRGKGG